MPGTSHVRALGFRPQLTRAARVSTSRAGVTLIELMIVLVILAIVLAAAFPVIVSSLKNQDAFEGARGVSNAFKQQRYRAQNLNRAAGVRVSGAEQKVFGYVSTSSRCSDMVLEQETIIFDIAQRNPDAIIAPGSPWFDRVICIKPNGRVLDQATGLPFADAVLETNDDLGGALRFEVGRKDGVGRNHVIKLPFNGIARLE